MSTIPTSGNQGTTQTAAAAPDNVKIVEHDENGEADFDKEIADAVGTPMYVADTWVGEVCDKGLDELIEACLRNNWDFDRILDHALVVNHKRCRPRVRPDHWVASRIRQKEAELHVKAPATTKTKYGIAKFPANLQQMDRKVCHDPASVFSYLVLPEEKHQEGLLPIGELNLIAGASGSWKTTVILFFIWLWSKGEGFFGRRTCRGNGKYLIVSFDRSESGFARTAVRMGFDPNDFNLVQLGEDEFSDRDPIEIIDDILNQQADEFKDLRLLVVEGIDLKAGDVPTKNKTASIADAHLVAKIMKRLIKAAKTHHFALLVSVGSPKQKGNDRYLSKRDQIIGSQAWARMAETVMHLAPKNQNDPNSKRVLSILPRNGKDEEILIELDENRRPKVVPKNTAKKQPPAWQIALQWLRSEKSGIHPGDLFRPKQVQDGIGANAPSTIAGALEELERLKQITRVDQGVYRLELPPYDAQQEVNAVAEATGLSKDPANSPENRS